MRVRIGYGAGSLSGPPDPDRFDALLDGLEQLGFDSLWLSERIAAQRPDPVVGLAYAAGRTRRIKLGTSVMVLPGRNPAILAKQLATLDRLSAGRLLPVFGLGVVDDREQQAFGVRRDERADLVEETLPLLRRLWAEESIDHDGARFRYRGLQVEPKPSKGSFDVWLGGRARSELVRIGRLADGWLASFITPEQARAGRAVVDEAASQAGREIDPGHFGVLVSYAHDGIPDQLVEQLSRRRPPVDLHAVIPSGVAAVRRRLEEFVAAGVTKFVLSPVAEPADWGTELAVMADAVLALQD